MITSFYYNQYKLQQFYPKCRIKLLQMALQGTLISNPSSIFKLHQDSCNSDNTYQYKKNI